MNPRGITTLKKHLSSHIFFRKVIVLNKPFFPLVSTGIVGKIACDHMRAPTYYIASVKGPCSWKAYPCDSYQLFQQGKCEQCTRECSAMGYNANPRMTGKFYLKTNSQEPFCGKYSLSTPFLFWIFVSILMNDLFCRSSRRISTESLFAFVLKRDLIINN